MNVRGLMPGRVRGFSLIELMIAMVLGLFLAIAAITMLMSFNRTYIATESSSRVQENARLAFELMARDLRQAAGNACSRHVPVANVLNDAASQWWSDWTRGVRGYESGTLAGSLEDTDAVEIRAGSPSVHLVAAHDPERAEFTLIPTQHDYRAGDIVLVCDYRQAAIFQVSSASAGLIGHAAIATATPGNCSKGLGFQYPMDCSDATGAAYRFPDESVVTKLKASRWFVAPNDHGGNSLFRSTLRGNGLTPAEEIVDGVDDMQLTYQINGRTNYVEASVLTDADWKNITSIRIALTVVGQDFVESGVHLKRALHYTVMLRNRSA